MNLADQFEYFSRTNKHWREDDIVAFNYQQRAELTRITAFHLRKARVEQNEATGMVDYECVPDVRLLPVPALSLDAGCPYSTLWPVYAKLFLGYREGKALPTCTYGTPLWGMLDSETVRSQQVVNLWPYDFPLNSRSEQHRPIAALWRPQLSVIRPNAFALSGLEMLKNGAWVAQRWWIEPMTFADMGKADEQHEVLGRRTLSPY